MSLPDRLAALDARWVPRAAQALRAGLRRSRGAGSAPACTPALARLDDRFAAAGPLGTVRRDPRIGLALAGVLVLAATGVAASRSGPGASTAPELPALAADVLGPVDGEDVVSYAAGSSADAAETARLVPAVPHLALVSLTRDATPEQAQALVVGLRVHAAYLRPAPPGSGPVVRTEVRDLVPDVDRAYAAQADGLTAQAALLLGQGARAEAQRAREQAAALVPGADLVVALLVSGPASLLAGMVDVRAVELAAQGVDPRGIDARVLLPEKDTGPPAEEPGQEPVQEPAP